MIKNIQKTEKMTPKTKPMKVEAGSLKLLCDACACLTLPLPNYTKQVAADAECQFWLHGVIHPKRDK